MGKRKKLSEMTPYERVGRVMHGLKWPEVEEIGMKIIGTCIARKLWALDEDPKEVADWLTKTALKEADWFRTEHSMDMAMLSVLERHAKAQKKEESEAKIIPINSH